MYVRRMRGLAIDRHSYISDGNGGNAVFHSHSLGALSHESVFDFMKRISTSWVVRFCAKTITEIMGKQAFMTKVLFKSNRVFNIVERITSNSELFSTLKAWLLTEDKKKFH